jgi:hypothetical protein
MGLIVTYSNQRLLPAKNNPEPAEDAYPMAASINVVRGTVLGQITSSKKYALYASGNSDGSQVAKCIAMYDFVTDASGNVSLTSTSGQTGGNEFGKTDLSAPVWISGCFNTDELNIGGTPGITSAVLTDLAGHLLSGSLTAGVMTF